MANYWHYQGKYIEVRNVGIIWYKIYTISGTSVFLKCCILFIIAVIFIVNYKNWRHFEQN